MTTFYTNENIIIRSRPQCDVFPWLDIRQLSYEVCRAKFATVVAPHCSCDLRMAPSPSPHPLKDLKLGAKCKSQSYDALPVSSIGRAGDDSDQLAPR